MVVLKRKHLEAAATEKENAGTVELRPVGLPLAVRQPFKPPLASRPEANGLGSGSLGQKKLASKLGAQSLLNALTRSITVGKQPAAAAGGEEIEAPEVVLFDPAEFPDLPEVGRPYTRVVVDPFLSAKLRPHQVRRGLQRPSASAEASYCTTPQL